MFCMFVFIPNANVICQHFKSLTDIFVGLMKARKTMLQLLAGTKDASKYLQIVGIERYIDTAFILCSALLKTYQDFW